MMGSEVSRNDDFSPQGEEAKSVSNQAVTTKRISEEGADAHAVQQTEEIGEQNQDVSLSATPSLPKPFTQSHDWNARFLLGNLENLPASARKLFSMGMLYLKKEQSNEREAGYSALFESLPPNDGTDRDHEISGESTSHEGVTTDKESSVQKTLAEGVKRISNLFVPMHQSAPLNCTQTYVQWRAAHDLINMYSFCLPTRSIIYLQPIGNFPDFVHSFSLRTNSMNLSFFEMLQGFTQIFFSGMEVMIQSPISVDDMDGTVRSRFHDVTNQRQYCVTDLYPCLQMILPRDGRSIVGVTWTDLYPEGFNFVLGEASDTHKAAVVSFGRFEPALYDAETSCDVSEVNGPLVWKLLKTLSHEVCHIFGFSHCSFFLCAMNESSSVSEALSQPLFLCPVCLRKLQRVCGFDILERYRLLQRFLSNVDSQIGDCQRLRDSVVWLDTCINYLTSTAA